MSITDIIKKVYEKLPAGTKKRVDKIKTGIKEYGKTYLYSWLAGELVYRTTFALSMYKITDSPWALLTFFYSPGSTCISAGVVAPTAVAIKYGKNKKEPKPEEKKPLENIVKEDKYVKHTAA